MPKSQQTSTDWVWKVQRTKTVIGTRAFAVAAATVWNRLPADIRTSTCTVQTFAQKLKTFYASRRIWGFFFILRGRNWLIIIIIRIRIWVTSICNQPSESVDWCQLLINQENPLTPTWRGCEILWWAADGRSYIVLRLKLKYSETGRITLAAGPVFRATCFVIVCKIVVKINFFYQWRDHDRHCSLQSILCMHLHILDPATDNNIIGRILI